MKRIVINPELLKFKPVLIFLMGITEAYLMYLCYKSLLCDSKVSIITLVAVAVIFFGFIPLMPNRKR